MTEDSFPLFCNFPTASQCPTITSTVSFFCHLSYKSCLILTKAGFFSGQNAKFLIPHLSPDQATVGCSDIIRDLRLLIWLWRFGAMKVLRMKEWLPAGGGGSHFPGLQQLYERPSVQFPAATHWSLALCDASCFPIQAMNMLQDLLNSICSLKIAMEGFQQELGQLKEDVAQVSGPEGQRPLAWVQKAAFGGQAFLCRGTSLRPMALMEKEASPPRRCSSDPGFTVNRSMEKK